jgi:hypothetical protein
VQDSQLAEFSRGEPFVSHLYEMPLGRIGVITLPVRGKNLFGSPQAAGPVRSGGEMARRKGAKSLALTGRYEGFGATVGLADLDDLRSHSRGLARLGIAAARPQCGTYFVPDDVADRFRGRSVASPARRVTSRPRDPIDLPEGV